MMVSMLKLLVRSINSILLFARMLYVMFVFVVGLQVGDRITYVNGIKTPSREAFGRVMHRCLPGDVIQLSIKRLPEVRNKPASQKRVPELCEPLHITSSYALLLLCMLIGVCLPCRSGNWCGDW
jgi:hypothetical protein